MMVCVLRVAHEAVQADLSSHLESLRAYGLRTLWRSSRLNCIAQRGISSGR